MFLNENNMPRLKKNNLIKSKANKMIKKPMKTKKVKAEIVNPSLRKTQVLKTVNFGDYTTSDEDDVTLSFSSVAEHHQDRDYSQFDVFSTDDEEPNSQYTIDDDLDGIEAIITDYAGLDVPTEAG